jgi:hypothetical protein
MPQHRPSEGEGFRLPLPSLGHPFRIGAERSLVTCPLHQGSVDHLIQHIWFQFADNLPIPAPNCYTIGEERMNVDLLVEFVNLHGCHARADVAAQDVHPLEPVAQVEYLPAFPDDQVDTDVLGTSQASSESVRATCGLRWSIPGARSQVMPGAPGSDAPQFFPWRDRCRYRVCSPLCFGLQDRLQTLKV